MSAKINELEYKIRELKRKLKATDYQAIKFAEGELSSTEFAPIRNQRRAWRDEINVLEAQLAVLKNSAK